MSISSSAVAQASAVAQGIEWAHKHGLITFPVYPPPDVCSCGKSCRCGKTPAVQGWQELTESVPVPEGYNFGMVMGHGIFLFDTDVRPAEGKDGEASLRAIEAEYGALPETATVASGSGRGGRHRFYRVPDGVTITQSSGKLGAGIDIKGEQSQAIGPGSLHASGQRYERVNDLPIADAPQWLIDLIKDSMRKKSAANGEYEQLGVGTPFYEERRAAYIEYLKGAKKAVSEEGGKKTLAEHVGARIPDYSLPFEEARALAWEIYNPRCLPPWDRENQQECDEFDRKLREGTGYGKIAKPGKWLEDHHIQEFYPLFLQRVKARLAAQEEHDKCLKAAEKAEKTGDYVKAVEYEDHAEKVMAEAEACDEPANDVQLPSASLKRKLGVTFGGWDQPVAPPEYLIDGLVTRGSVGMFVAHGNSLKTWTALSMALAVSRGEKWLGKYATKKGTALFIDYESGKAEIHRRVRMLGHQGTESFGYTFADVYANDEAFWTELEEMAPALVVIDSLAASSPGVDENDTRAAWPLLRAKLLAEKTGAAVLFLHHANKGERGDQREKVRGTSAFFAALDFAYRFESLDETENTKSMRIASIKTRSGKKPPPLDVRLTDKGLALIEEAAVHMAKSAETPEMLRAAIKRHLANGPKGRKELARALNKRETQVRAEVDILLEQGQLVEGKGARNRKPLLLNGPEDRKRRVIQAIRENDPFPTAARLAAEACVSTHDIEMLIKQEVIAKQLESETDCGGFIIL